jgi:hypothetical protein
MSDLLYVDKSTIIRLYQLRGIYMAQRMHRGGVLGFVLVGVLLLALVAGGIYLVRHQLIANNPTSGKESTDKTAAPAAPRTTTDSSDKADDSTKNQSSSDLEKALQSQSEAEKKAKAQKEAQEKQVAASSASQSNTAAHLPETGPGDTLATIVGAMFLAGTIFAYVRSRALI